MPDTSHRSFAKALLAPLLGAFLLWSAPALADAAPDCTVTPYKIGLAVAHQVPGAIVDHLRGVEAIRFVAAFNAAPPESNIPGDEVLIFHAPNKPGVLVVLFAHGCLTSHATMSEGSLRKLLGPSA